jgi:hypothetical protein
VRPVDEEDEFDVDVVLLLSFRKDSGGLPDPVETLKWMEARLRGNGNYADKTEIKKRCVRINYAGDFHLDVVPAESEGLSGTSMQIPDKQGRWIVTDPKGLIKWVNEKELECGGRFKHIVKYLKWWCKAVASENASVSSSVLTVLVGNHVASGASDAEALVETMGSLSEWLSSLSRKPAVTHPTIATDMAEQWKDSEFKAFRSSFANAAETAKAALDEVDKSKSVGLWQKLFGDQFPKLDDDDGDEGPGGYVPPSGPGKKSSRRMG